MHLTLKSLTAPFLVILLMGLIVLYAYNRSRSIIEGPRILVDTPLSGEIATTSLITIRGTIAHAKEITLDGRPIFIDTDGQFSEQLLLMEGYNIIELVAKDTEGREERKAIELTLRE